MMKSAGRSRVWQQANLPSIYAYFNQLARRDRAEADEAAWLQDAIDQGLSSGVDKRTSARMFSDIKTKYLGQNG